jgi:hypothetical protein
VPNQNLANTSYGGPAGAEPNLQNKHTFYPNDKTFYVQNNGAQPEIMTTYNRPFDASITKVDFPDIKTRGRVHENRVDLELERNGNILTQGRDE